MLHSLSIPYEILADGERSFVVVPTGHFEKARYELWQYEQENKQAVIPGPRFTPVLQNGLPGVFAYLFVITIVALLASESAFDRNWLSAGRVDGTLIRDGEWWRSVTALTLHSGLPHFAGNAGFGALFGVLAGRFLGSGVTWFAVVVSSSLANLINTLLLDSSHRAIGASTAVFAALGLLAGFVWRGKLMKQDHWPYRIGPIVGGLALLAYTGSGNENTDVGAHLMGFVCGFLAGIVTTYGYHYVPIMRVQRIAGALAVTVIAFSWLLALRLWA